MNEIEYTMYILRQRVKVAKLSKEKGWPRLFDYSIKEAEREIEELEKKIDV